MPASTINISSDIFSSALRALMENRGLTQTSLAERAGVSQATVSGWLNGSVPQRCTLMELARALEVAPSDLTGGKTPPGPLAGSIKEESGVYGSSINKSVILRWTKKLRTLADGMKALADDMEEELK